MCSLLLVFSCLLCYCLSFAQYLIVVLIVNNFMLGLEPSCLDRKGGSEVEF